MPNSNLSVISASLSGENTQSLFKAILTFHQPDILAFSYLRIIFANSASNNIKRQASYGDLKRLLNESGVNNPATKALRKMVNIYEEYLFTKDNVYNSRSERDIRSREFIRESTLEQLKDIARTNPNAKL